MPSSPPSSKFNPLYSSFKFSPRAALGPLRPPHLTTDLTLQIEPPWSSHCGSEEMNLTSIHEDAGSIPGLAVSYGVGCRYGLDLSLLWLWCRPVATAPIQPLYWDPSCAIGAAIKRKKRKKGNGGAEKSCVFDDISEQLHRYRQSPPSNLLINEILHVCIV